MNEFKNICVDFVLLIVLCSGSFGGGYILSNSKAIRQLNEANQHLAELQQEYNRAIATAKQQTELANKQLRDIGDQLSQQVQSSGRATEELSELIKQIQKQKLNIQI